jgi:hypothetical protein
MKLLIATLTALVLATTAFVADPAAARANPLEPGESAKTPTAVVTVNNVDGDAYVELCATSGMVVSTSTWHSDEGKVTGGTYPKGGTPLAAGQCEKGSLTFNGAPTTVTYTPDNNPPITWTLN